MPDEETAADRDGWHERGHVAHAVDVSLKEGKPGEQPHRDHRDAVRDTYSNSNSYANGDARRAEPSAGWSLWTESGRRLAFTNHYPNAYIYTNPDTNRSNAYHSCK